MRSWALLLIAVTSSGPDGAAMRCTDPTSPERSTPSTNRKSPRPASLATRHLLDDAPFQALGDLHVRRWCEDFARLPVQPVIALHVRLGAQIQVGQRPVLLRCRCWHQFLPKQRTCTSR